MKAVLLALLTTTNLFCPMRVAAAPMGHCAAATATPVPGDPAAYRIETAHGSTVARRYPQPSAGQLAATTAVIRVFPNSFDADGDTLGTVHDTILVAPGTVIRWVRAGPGFHTVTNGADSGDPNAAAEYNAIFDDLTNSFERTFVTLGKHDFFCFIHEPTMEGTVIVTSATTGVTPLGVLRRATFTRPPSPNPTRGELSFAIALPRAARVSLTVHDVAGRSVATIEDNALPAGEYPYRWNGRDDGGHLLQSGRYFVRLAVGDVRESRAISLVH